MITFGALRLGCAVWDETSKGRIVTTGGIAATIGITTAAIDSALQLDAFGLVWAIVHQCHTSYRVLTVSLGNFFAPWAAAFLLLCAIAMLPLSLVRLWRK